MTENTNKQQEAVNPFDYTYDPGAKVEIDGQLLMALMNYINGVIDSNTETFSPYKYKFVNTKTGKEVKTPKKEDLDAGVVTKIVDIDNTFFSEPRVYMNKVATDGARLSLNLQSAHLQAIEEGKAKAINVEKPKGLEIVTS